MKRNLPLWLGLLVVSVALCVQTVRVAQLQKHLASERATSPGSEATQPPSPPASSWNGSAALPSGATVPSGETEATRPEVSASGASEAPSQSSPAAGEKAGNPLAQMMSDPAMKKMMRQQQAMGIRMMYGDLGKELGLEAGQVDTLMEALADRQMDNVDQGLAMMNGSSDLASEENVAKIAEAQKKHESRIKEILGEEGHARFKEYEAGMGERFMLQQYQQQFSARGQPLADQQRDALFQIMAEERKRSPVSPFQPGQNDIAAQRETMLSDEAMHDLMARQEDLNRRINARAGELLSPEQMQTLTEVQKQMTEMQQAGLQMSRQMFRK